MTMEKSSRDVGDAFEDTVLSKLGPGFSKTAGSGSVFKNGDIRHSRLIVECKVKNNVTGFNAPRKELDKLKKEALKQGKDWLFIEVSSAREPMVLCDLNTFLELTEEWREKYST